MLVEVIATFCSKSQNLGEIVLNYNIKPHDNNIEYLVREVFQNLVQGCHAMSFLSTSPFKYMGKMEGFVKYTCLKKCLLNILKVPCQVTEVVINLLFNKDH